ncbi:cytochrome c3 family protein [Hanstruepera flava]|uniref:cytochrome c3 family protein n=1 Tax=Hanstruepera flava TaxID=2930218 RepID=UPI002029296A|nr:cytochrome c3 family protein [Hanstruepera flava]
MNKHTVAIQFIVITVLALSIYSCKHKEDEYHNVIEKIEAKSKEYKGVTVSSESYFDNIELIEISEDGTSFLIPDRKNQIQSYACTECHSKPLQDMENTDLKKAHWDIEIVHANENTMNCTTCHNPENMDNLKSLTSNHIDFNASYQLCSQCHTKQFEDWKGGAHGKEIGGWAPPRASLTCVNCHNPHNPAFGTKWPARFNTQKIKERK